MKNKYLDKIDRNSKPTASRTVITYGDGNVEIDTNGEIAAFEIDYTGAFKGVNSMGEGWSDFHNSNKLIIFSLAQSELGNLLFKYVGSLKIKKVKCVGWDLSVHFASIKDTDTNEWVKAQGNWGADARKYEEVEKKDFVYRKVRKTRI